MFQEQCCIHIWSFKAQARLRNIVIAGHRKLGMHRVCQGVVSWQLGTLLPRHIVEPFFVHIDFA